MALTYDQIKQKITQTFKIGYSFIFDKSIKTNLPIILNDLNERIGNEENTIPAPKLIESNKINDKYILEVFDSDWKEKDNNQVLYIDGSTHGKNLDCIVLAKRIFRGDYYSHTIEVIQNEVSMDITIRTQAKFTGKIIII